ncbi:MAG TPA: acyl-CoA synthetase [Burkholderiales bacterium]|jgi:predicted LPLAT superfamily acyltransferase|nr:acyl-CoA synthetase [Burkholderiales bacterium]
MPRRVDGRVEGEARAPDWVRRPERSNALALHAIVWVARVIGRGAARLLLHPICLYFVAFSPRARSASREYLSRVLGRKARLRDLFRHYHRFAAVLLDRIFLLNDELTRFDVRMHGAEVFEEAMAKGEGCLMLSAHLGSFEVARAVGRTNGVRIRMLMYEENARKVGAILQAVNPRLHDDVIPLGRLDAMLQVEAALGRGEVVGMLADRGLGEVGTMRGATRGAMLGAMRDAVRCEFLGRPAQFPTGPIRIGIILNRPMLLLFGVYRGANRYDVYIERFAAPDEARGRARDAAVDELLRRYVGRLEHYCRIAPYNWFNFYDFWR